MLLFAFKQFIHKGFYTIKFVILIPLVIRNYSISFWNRVLLSFRLSFYDR